MAIFVNPSKNSDAYKIADELALESAKKRVSSGDELQGLWRYNDDTRCVSLIKRANNELICQVFDSQQSKQIKNDRKITFKDTSLNEKIKIILARWVPQLVGSTHNPFLAVTFIDITSQISHGWHMADGSFDAWLEISPQDGKARWMVINAVANMFKRIETENLSIQNLAKLRNEHSLEIATDSVGRPRSIKLLPYLQVWRTESFYTVQLCQNADQISFKILAEDGMCITKFLPTPPGMTPTQLAEYLIHNTRPVQEPFESLKFCKECHAYSLQDGATVRLLEYHDISIKDDFLICEVTSKEGRIRTFSVNRSILDVLGLSLAQCIQFFQAHELLVPDMEGFVKFLKENTFSENLSLNKNKKNDKNESFLQFFSSLFQSIENEFLVEYLRAHILDLKRQFQKDQLSFKFRKEPLRLEPHWAVFNFWSAVQMTHNLVIWLLEKLHIVGIEPNARRLLHWQKDPKYTPSPLPSAIHSWSLGKRYIANLLKNGNQLSIVIPSEQALITHPILIPEGKDVEGYASELTQMRPLLELPIPLDVPQVKKAWHLMNGTKVRLLESDTLKLEIVFNDKIRVFRIPIPENRDLHEHCEQLANQFPIVEAGWSLATRDLPFKFVEHVSQIDHQKELSQNNGAVTVVSSEPGEGSSLNGLSNQYGHAMICIEYLRNENDQWVERALETYRMHQDKKIKKMEENLRKKSGNIKQLEEKIIDTKEKTSALVRYIQSIPVGKPVMLRAHLTKSDGVVLISENRANFFEQGATRILPKSSVMQMVEEIYKDCTDPGRVRFSLFGDALNFFGGKCTSYNCATWVRTKIQLLGIDLEPPQYRFSSLVKITTPRDVVSQRDKLKLSEMLGYLVADAVYGKSNN